MARGRSNFGTRFKQTSGQKERQKKASKTTKNLVSAPFAVANAVSRKPSGQRKHAARSTHEQSFSASDQALIDRVREEMRIEAEAQAEKERLEREAKKAAKAAAREKAKAEGKSRGLFSFLRSKNSRENK